MNKNLFIYSFKYLAVLLALVTFSSCERDEFTEQDAFDLQQAQLDAQAAREAAALAAQDQRVMDMARFRRSLDSLTRINAGGKVFYTVNVVPGGSSAFSSGRFEEVEGLDGVTVTASQFATGSGANAFAFTQQVTTVAGIASFELYSGEVTINIEAPNHTDLNYTANLTPDGGVPNGSLVYVGNVVPVFDDPNNPAAGSEENLATVKGMAFAELDITGGNNFEEAVPDGTKVRAFIDVANPAFKSKYIDQANDEGVNNGGQPTRSGFIQRFAYEEAASTTGLTVTTPLNNDTAPEGGEYSITIGATASGLPIVMKFDDFAADRTYFFGDALGTGLFTGSGDGDTGFTAGQKRFIYTQNTEVGGNQNPTPLPFQGAVDLAQLSDIVFDFATTEATATATITGGDAVASVTITDGGFYYEAPTVTFSAPTTGTTAVGTAVLGAIPATATGDAAAARARGLKMVTGVTIATGAGGSGYTSNPTVTFTRKSYTGRTAAGIPVANGTGEVAAPSSTIKYIRIMDGGFGMNPAVAAGTAVTGVGSYTGVAPAVVFNNGIAPAGGVLATANAIIDQVVGTATEIQVTNGGDGYDDANLNITFNYGSDASVTAIEGPDADATANLFIVDAGGQLVWNNAGQTRTLTTNPAGQSGDVQYAPGTNYTFVPSVTLTGLTAPAGATLPTFIATVTDGLVTSIEMQGATSGWGAAGTVFNGTVQINSNPDGVNITAQGFTQGGSIDTYEILNYGTTNDVYKATVEAAGETFNYLTTNANGNGQILNGAGTVMTPADYALNSDFIVVFENPTAAAGDNAWGYPIFDNGGNNLVGILIINQGIGYTNPSPATYNFWVIPADLAGTPKAGLTKYAQLDSNPLNDANANATAARTANNLTITFTDGGLGYAIRPEFVISGGNKSAEDLAGINTAINGAIRGQLNFNGAGSITNTSVAYNGALPFTAADLAAEPITVTVSTDRLAGIFTAEANGGGVAAFNGFILASAAGNGTDYDPEFEYTTNGGATFTATALDFFNLLEASSAFTNADRVGSGGVTNPNFKYITPPTFTVEFVGLNTGGAGVAVLNTGADIVALETTTVGSIPSGLVITSFIFSGNDTSYPAAGERFRTIGGASRFEVFSGLTYIRDANYGTGIELE